MSEFGLYFALGKDHILDYLYGYDHIIFVITLCAIYVIEDWKKILVQVTAFTVGHSITLALATFNVIAVRTEMIEFLIPATILITSVSNLFQKEDQQVTNKWQANYFYAIFFGLVHGLGFSNYLRALLGKDQTIITQLLAFNLGLELGQIIVVSIFLLTSFILVDLIGVKRRDWKMVVSSATAGIALVLMKDRMFWLAQ
jgi:hypothetical protein